MISRDRASRKNKKPHGYAFPTVHERTALRERLWATIGDVNGLSDRQVVEHVEHVAKVVEKARRA